MVLKVDGARPWEVREVNRPRLQPNCESEQQGYCVSTPVYQVVNNIGGATPANSPRA
jgi:hypothetical protein